MKALATLAAVAATTVLGAAPSWQDRLVSRREVVPIFAVVTDRDGRRVAGLTQERFEVREDGRKTDIVSFANQPQPLTVGLLFDSSGSMSPHLPTLRKGANLAIRALRPDDRMSIVPLTTRPAFEGDRARLEAAVETNVFAGGSSPIWDSLRVNVGALLREPEPRLLVVFTDGYDTVYRSPWNVLTEYYVPNVIGDQIRKTGVPLVVVGLARRFNEWFERAARRAGATVLKPKSDDELSSALPNLIEDAHSAYLLGILAAEDSREHRLEVRVSLRGAKVRARSSYTAGSSVR